jgi:hypothetical protein
MTEDSAWRATLSPVIVTGTRITASPRPGTLPLSSLTPVASVLPSTAISTEAPL